MTCILFGQWSWFSNSVNDALTRYKNECVCVRVCVCECECSSVNKQIITLSSQPATLSLTQSRPPLLTAMCMRSFRLLLILGQTYRHNRNSVLFFSASSLWETAECVMKSTGAPFAPQMSQCRATPTVWGQSHALSFQLHNSAPSQFLFVVQKIGTACGGDWEGGGGGCWQAGEGDRPGGRGGGGTLRLGLRG